ncbi:MAG: caspase family protein [Nitrospirae bacterium]|nr:caspase family protein [Nitrospirota bacterium]
MLRQIIVSLVFTALLCTAPGISSAEKYAVLIGISNYKPPVPPLLGPVNDVMSIKDLLTKDYGFAIGNIKTLSDSEATKASILQSLSELTKNTQKGDFIFIYFSGHGTSQYDSKMMIPIGNSTEAIAPFDVIATGNDKDKIISSLIVGKTDLRPIISELDKDRRVFVVFDSCFSGNSVRDIVVERGPIKHLHIPELTGTQDSANAHVLKAGDSQEKYPYKNTIYISASDETTQARDLRDGYLTFDGKPHGALTNAIIKGLRGEADTNNDGVVTYEELYQFVITDTGRFAHVPLLLSPNNTAINTPVFEKRLTVYHAQKGIAYSKGDFRVKLGFDDDSDRESRYTDIGTRLLTIKGVKLVRNEYELLISNKSGHYRLYLPSGDKLYEASDLEDAIKRVTRYVKVRKLVTLSNQSQKFNVYINVGGTNSRSVFKNVESLDFTIKSEEDAYIVLLNVDAAGYVTVLLPKSGDSGTPVKKGIINEFKGLGKIEPPFGAEFIKVFAYKDKVDGIDRVIGKTIDPSSDDFVKLLDIITDQKGWAEATRQIVTVP